MSERQKDFQALPSIVVAYGKNGEIGVNNKLPWPKMTRDLRRFAQLTMGGVVIMGRSTYESLPGTLKNRENVILSRDERWRTEHENVYSSLEDALDAYTNDERELYIIGGASVYKQFYPLARKIMATEINVEIPEADTYFQLPNPNEWRVVSREEYSADEDNPFDHSFVTYERVAPIVDINKALNRPDYAKELQAIEDRAECPFCYGRVEEQGNEVLEELEYWIVTTNVNPYKGSDSHLLLIPKRHVENISDLGEKSQTELMKIINKYSKSLEYGGIAMRFGDVEETGASVAHFHIHIIKPTNDNDGIVRFRISR